MKDLIHHAAFIGVATLDEVLEKRAAEMKAQGALRNSMAVAYANTPPKPVSTEPKGPKAVKPAPSGVKPKPPSKARYYNDKLKSIGAPQQSGDRIGVPSIGQ